MKKHNLLDNPIFTVQTSSGLGKVTLPGLFALLETDGLDGMPRLAPYQQHAIYAFLTQLAAIVFKSEKPSVKGEEQWREKLLDLTNRMEESWCLVVEDPEKAAFMQPPVFDKKGVSFYDTPDALDILEKSKNHDVKMNLSDSSDIELWTYALITRQTMGGYVGGHYGVSRMNGSYSSRPCVSRVTSLRWGQRWQRDLRLMTQKRKEVIEKFQYQKDGISLVWLEPWDLKTPLNSEELDPWYIEICRPIRLHTTDRGLRAASKPTKAMRISSPQPSFQCGYTGDPWIPCVKDDEGFKSITVQRSGFHISLVHDILFGNKYEKPLSMQSEEGDGCAWILMSVLVGGQSKTEGYHERLIPITTKANRNLQDSDLRKKLYKRSMLRLIAAYRMQHDALRRSLWILLNPTKDPGKDPKREVLSMSSETEDIEKCVQSLYFSDKTYTDKLLTAFSEEVNRVFIEELWKSLPEDVVDSTISWWKTLGSIANNVLTQAINQMPTTSQHQYKAIAKASCFLERSMNNLQKGIK